MGKAREARLRWPTLAVVVVLTVITGVSGFGVRHASRAEERRLLHERAAEIALILTDTFSGLQTQLSTMAAETELNGADAKAFLGAANALSPAGGGFASPAGLARVDPSTDAVTFLATTGSLERTPSVEAVAVIRRAAAVSPPKVASSVFGSGARRSFGLAYPVGVHGLVVYEQLPIDLEAAASAATASEPFHELNVALYAAARRDPRALLLTTNGTVPSSGDIATASAPFGADTWLVAIRATSPLNGSFASKSYLLVLLGGALITVVLGFLVEILLRRRDYAMELVAERTEALQQSLGELERAQEQLVQSTRLAAIGQLASAIGHELRNPLGVITNAHYLLRTELERQGSGPDAFRHLTTAEREVGASTLIVSDLLDYARGREPVTSAVDVVDLISEVQTVLPAPPEITVERHDAGGDSLAQADRDQLRQVLLNLLSNAYEAMPGGGTVTISTEAAADLLRIRVSDTGVGMDEETQQQLFEPFFTRKTKGIGLGMSVTKRIVETHHGVISVESALGAGTTFTVDLPIARPVPAVVLGEQP
ncbi:MAG TPA: ATP-binding protein [Mycobacteriales bacterium]|jgi:signal transduction histidine kinase|nr:ATP-binding protein [Mycobacteriales bacterium]